MKRDIDIRLEEWKKSPRRKPLVLNGARQVGKTYALKHLGKHSYQYTAYFNFEKDEALSRYFDETLDPKRLIALLSIHSNLDIEPNSTLIIFDEIQECPKALNSLKYFCEEANDYHFASAGSLLGLRRQKTRDFLLEKSIFYIFILLIFRVSRWELIATSGEPPYYWQSEGTAEIDFLLENDHSILPLEVKSGDSQKKKSLLVFDQKFNPAKLLRATTMN